MPTKARSWSCAPPSALGIVTALVRIEGRPFGLDRQQPRHLGGAIDSDAADKAARFLQLCDAYDLPIVSLCDTPGFMVGPEAEKTALVRHVCRMFVTAASLTVPWFTVVLRKGYGLGAQAMAGGGFHAQSFTVSWPTGEFGGMGLEGAVRLGFRKELAAIEDAVEREKLFRTMVAKYYETGKATNIASVLEIDQVIDPIETRRWILRGLEPASAAAARDAQAAVRGYVVRGPPTLLLLIEALLVEWTFAPEVFRPVLRRGAKGERHCPAFSRPARNAALT